MSNTREQQQDNKEPQVEFDELTKVKLIGGHDFDGIRELDNKLPPWLKYLFYISIVFSFAYLTLVLVFEDESILQDLEYKNEMAAVMAINMHETHNNDEKAAPVVRTEAEKIASGQETFGKTCSICHGKFGEGLVGPNFTDEYWIHGGSREDMHKIIINGVIEKGMISYKNQLTQSQIEDVISYIQSLNGTNPPNQKAAEGKKYVP